MGGTGTTFGSHPLDEAVHHALFAGLVEPDGQLVAVDGDDVAEYLVAHAVTGLNSDVVLVDLTVSLASMARGGRREKTETKSRKTHMSALVRH
jgi:hypothetical protein